jgi:hypothetical protein
MHTSIHTRSSPIPSFPLSFPLHLFTSPLHLSPSPPLHPPLPPPLSPPLSHSFSKRKKTLVLDLDETLIHSIPLRGGMSREYVANSFILDIELQGQRVSFRVLLRPHLSTFLKVKLVLKKGNTVHFISFFLM